MRKVNNGKELDSIPSTLDISSVQLKVSKKEEARVKDKVQLVKQPSGVRHIEFGCAVTVKHKGAE